MRRRFGLERLEDRLVLSPSTWSGDVSGSWSDPGNWDTLPTTGVDLSFPSTGSNLTNTDDLTSVTSYGMLTLSGGGYSIGGTTGVTFTSIDSSQTTGPNTVSLPIDLSSPATVTVDTAGQSLVLGGAISGSDGLTKEGSGELDLTQANTYTGTTAVQAGTLLVDGVQGSSPVTVGTGSTLGGIGTVGTITATGGTLSPGDSGPGLLVDTGDLNLGPDSNSKNSTFIVQLDAGTTPGTDYTQLQVAGQINLTGAQLNLTLGSGFVPTAGQTYTIVDSTGTLPNTTTFAGLPGGSIITASGTSFLVSYDNGANSNSIVLTELAASSTALTATPSAAAYGESVQLQATVTGAGVTPTGMVEFLNGTTSLGTMSLSGGIATLNVTSLPVATNSITAVYQGDTNYGPSTSAAVSVPVTKSSSASSVTFSPANPVVGSSVTLTATVSASGLGAGTPTGTVEFLDGTDSLGDMTLSGGTATLTTTTLPVGANSITVQYQGDTNFLASTSTPAVNVQVGQASTTTTLTTAPTSSVFGQSVTLTATIAVENPGSPTPSGTVTFFNGTTSLGTGTLSGGVATLAVTTLPVATNNSITATYGGDTNYTTSKSTAVTLAVAQASTTTTLTTAPTSSVFGQSVTLTATIAAVSPGVGTPTGTVTFFNGTTSLGTGTLSGGVATLAVTSLPVAANSITATYGGATDFTTSTSTAVTLTVAQASTTTTLTIAPTSSVFGQSVTLTATIAAVSPGAGTPTGTVTFFNGTTSLGTGTLNSSDVATLVVSSLPVATNSITATYGGATDFTTSTSTAVTLTVAQASTTTTVTLSVPSPTPFEAVTLTATIAATSPGVGTPTGTVTFFNGTTSLGTGTLNSSGVATLALSSLTIGSNSITAQYGGDTDFKASTSTAVAVVVGTANEQWLSAVYEVELDRPLAASDLQGWEADLTNGTSRKVIAYQIANSPEGKQTIVQNAFQQYLGRSASSTEVTRVMLAAASTHTSVRAIILGSREYFDNSGGNIQSYVNSLETDVLGTTGNQAYLESQLARGVLPATVAEEVLLSTRGKSALLAAAYQTVLNRAPTTQENVAGVELLDQGIYLRNIQAALIASDEFYNDVVVSMISSS